MSRITTVFTQAHRFRTVVSARGNTVDVTPGRRSIAVMLVTTGLTGKPGTTGEAQISTDAGNQLTQGSDQRLFVHRAEAVADPLAYYILASN